MTQDELKLVLEALKWCHGGEPCGTAEAIAVVEKVLAQRTWVGLTDEEIQECYNGAYKIVQGRRLENAFYKTIEAKLKERNT